MIIRGGRRPVATCLSRWKLHRYSTSARIVPVTVEQGNEFDLDRFRDIAYKPEKPLVIKAAAGGETIPAVRKWFDPHDSDRSTDQRRSISSHLAKFSETSFPYELIAPQISSRGSDDTVQKFQAWLASTGDQGHSALAMILHHHISTGIPPQSTQQHLLRFHAPLALLTAALQYNHTRTTATSLSPLTNLYIAQSSLTDLPPDLQPDVPAPEIVRSAGKGDIYDSSVWLGLEPTYTPWHRDPNPNLFVQLCSSKSIRVMPPRSGEHLFRLAQRQVGGRTGSSRIRGEEMMLGPERDAMHEAVWGEEAEGLQEARLDPGDALFIPKGWWHSVKSNFTDGRLNGSVNWWFR